MAAAVLGRSMVLQIERSVDEREMRKGLWEIAKLAAFARIILLRQQPDIVAQAEQTPEQRSRLRMTTLQHKIVRKPEAAREEHALTWWQPVHPFVRAVAQDQPVD